MNTTELKEKNTSNRFFETKNVAQDSIRVVLLFISGLFKIPSPIPGTEFQLSASLAVSIGRIRGFLHYLTIGIVASIIGMILGLQTIYNVIIAMVYRVVAGLILTFIKKDPLALMLAGPMGTFAARLVLAAILGVPWLPLVLAATPGMIFTAITAPILTHPFLSHIPDAHNPEIPGYTFPG